MKYRHLDSDPTPLIDPARNLVVFINAKCANTTVKHWFFISANIRCGNAIEMLRIYGAKHYFPLLFKAIKNPSINWLTDNKDVRDIYQFWARRIGWDFLYQNRCSSFRKVVFCRDPYNRIVSAFIDKFCGEDLSKPWAADIVSEAGGGGVLSFYDLLQYIKEKNEAELNRHFRRQTLVFDRFDIDFFVRVEHMEMDSMRCKSLLGTEKLNLLFNIHQSHQYEKGEEESGSLDKASNREIMELKKKLGRFPSKKRFLSDAAIQLINEIYKEDFRRLPYEMK